MAKKVIFALSVIFNVVFLLFVLLSLLGGTSSFALLNYGAAYLSSALIVSVPHDGSSLGFGPVDISIRLGSTAYLQFAAIQGGRQSNMSVEPLYDHGVVDVVQGGFGLSITGISPGEAVLQVFSPSGFKDIAYVTVYY